MIIRKMNTKSDNRRKRPSLPLLLLILFVLGIVSWSLPVPKIKAQSSYTYKSRPTAVTLSWPTYGQSALGAVGYGVLDSHGPQITAPMASVTKVITALSVMKHKPLKVGDQGPTITVTAEDVASYNYFNSNGGSVVTVSQGEQISEYQALQAMLLPSANNMADTLARWAFGSTDNYTKFANAYMKQLGLKSTVIDDASGFSPKSTSTAQDLTNLGILFEKNPVLAAISSQAAAEIPVAGTVHNTNWLLGVDGVDGIKTGNTDQAGGCYLFASTRTISGQKVHLVGAIMNAPDLTSAIGDARPLIRSADTGFEKVTVVKRDQAVGTYIAAWGESAKILSRDDISILTWKTRQVASSMSIAKKDVSVAKNQEVGELTATVWDKKSTGKLIVDNRISPPSWQWRLYRRHI